MGQVTVLHRAHPGAPVTTVRLNADPFEVVAWVLSWRNPDADNSPTARLPAWEAVERRQAVELKRKGRKA